VDQSGTVGEYTTAGATVNASLISGLSGPHGIAISSVPEPSAGVLVALGATALWLWRRCKQFARPSTEPSTISSITE
jgi:hypothetical protein